MNKKLIEIYKYSKVNVTQEGTNVHKKHIIRVVDLGERIQWVDGVKMYRKL